MSASFVSQNSWLSKPIQAIILDITGVLYESGTNYAIKGSIEAIEKLRAVGIPFRLLTNETQKNASKLLEKLMDFGYDFNETEIITPIMICKQYLQTHKLRPHLLTHPNIKSEFEPLDQDNPNCVVIGDADEYFTFQSMNDCLNLLMRLKDQCLNNQDAGTNENLLISLGNNKYYHENGQYKLDVGSFMAALEYATDLKAKVIGKPSKNYFQAAMDSFKSNFNKDDVLMIGDDIFTDVGGAQDFGIRGVLVRTGKYTPLYEKHPFIVPDAIVDNLQCAIDQILLQQK